MEPRGLLRAYPGSTCSHSFQPCTFLFSVWLPSEFSIFPVGSLSSTAIESEERKRELVRSQNASWRLCSCPAQACKCHPGILIFSGSTKTTCSFWIHLVCNQCSLVYGNRSLSSGPELGLARSHSRQKWARYRYAELQLKVARKPAGIDKSVGLHQEPAEFA